MLQVSWEAVELWSSHCCLKELIALITPHSYPVLFNGIIILQAMFRRYKGWFENIQNENTMYKH